MEWLAYEPRVKCTREIECCFWAALSHTVPCFSVSLPLYVFLFLSLMSTYIHTSPHSSVVRKENKDSHCSIRLQPRYVGMGRVPIGTYGCRHSNSPPWGKTPAAPDRGVDEAMLLRELCAGVRGIPLPSVLPSISRISTVEPQTWDVHAHNLTAWLGFPLVFQILMAKWLRNCLRFQAVAQISVIVFPREAAVAKVKKAERVAWKWLRSQCSRPSMCLYYCLYNLPRRLVSQSGLSSLQYNCL